MLAKRDLRMAESYDLTTWDTFAEKSIKRALDFSSDIRGGECEIDVVVSMLNGR
jgi:hypothetical protein